MLATGAVIAAALPVEASDAAALGGLCLAMSTGGDLANQGGGGGGDDPNTELTYEGSAKHGETARGTAKGVAAKYRTRE